MKHSRLIGAFAILLCIASCNNVAEKTMFEKTTNTYPMCDDINDSSVVFVNVRNGNKESKGCTGAYPFFNGSTIVKTEYGWGFINERFQPMFNDYFMDATHFSEGVSFTVKPSEMIKAIDSDGNVLYEIRDAERVYALSEERAVYNGTNGLYGLLDSKGNIVVPAKYYSCENFVINDAIIVSNIGENNRPVYGVINSNGDEIIPVRYSKIKRHDEGFTVFRINKAGNGEKAAFSNFKGEMLYDYEFYDIIKDGKWYCYKTGRNKWGWINSKGKEKIHAKFLDVLPFNNKALTFAKGSNNSIEWGIIDKKGEWVVRPKFTSVELTESHPIISVTPHNFGVVDFEGNVLIKPDKRSVRHIYEDFYLIENSYSEFGIMKADGNEEWTARPSYEKFRGIRHNPSIYVNTDFIDIVGVYSAVRTHIDNLSKCTVEDLMDKYNMKSSNFSKSKGSTALLSKTSNRGYEMKVSAERLYAWNSKYDWWEGTTYSFNNKAVAKRFNITVTLQDKYMSHKSDILKYIKSELGMADGTSKVDISNKTIEVADISKRSVQAFKVTVTIND